MSTDSVGDPPVFAIEQSERLLVLDHQVRIAIFGAFNPGIVGIDWLVDLGIVTPDVGAETETDEDLPFSNVLTFPWGSLEVDLERVVVSVAEADAGRAAQVLSTAFGYLPHTPMSAIAISHELHFTATAPETAARLRDVFLPTAPWGEVGQPWGERQVMVDSGDSTAGDQRIILTAPDGAGTEFDLVAIVDRDVSVDGRRVPVSEGLQQVVQVHSAANELAAHAAQRLISVAEGD